MSAKRSGNCTFRRESCGGSSELCILQPSKPTQRVRAPALPQRAAPRLRLGRQEDAVSQNKVSAHSR